MNTFLAVRTCVGTGAGTGVGSFSAARSGSEANATLKAAPHILRAAADEIRMVFVILSVCEAREECN